MNSYMKTIVQYGQGEGVVLRSPESPYENGRSHFVLKFKTNKDAEALVVDTKGGCFQCKLPNNKIIIAKTKPNLGLDIKRGNVVSYTIHNNSIYRVREDLKWEEVVDNYIKESTTQKTRYSKEYRNTKLSKESAKGRKGSWKFSFSRMGGFSSKPTSTNNPTQSPMDSYYLNSSYNGYSTTVSTTATDTTATATPKIQQKVPRWMKERPNEGIEIYNALPRTLWIQIVCIIVLFLAVSLGLWWDGMAWVMVIKATQHIACGCSSYCGCLFKKFTSKISL